MLFTYKSVDSKGIKKEGQIDAPNRDMAISGLQRRGLIVLSVEENKGSKSLLDITVFERVSKKDVVIFSRQISTLFSSQVSALKSFSMLADNTDNPLFSRKLVSVSDDLRAGLSISDALSKHSDVFSDFYINMVKAGEESGKLNQIFKYLADYLDRQYALTNKTRNALIYPVFVVITFIVVMILMFIMVIPKLSSIILDSGQDVPLYTKAIISISDFFVNYGFIFVILLVMLGVWIWKLSRSASGRSYIDKVRLSIPLFGGLYKKLFLSRIADNMDTMLVSGIPMVRSIEITSRVVGSIVYKDILDDVSDGVKSGLSLSTSLEKYSEHIPKIMVQMVKVGEETGSLGQILKTLAIFYKREVDDAVDTLVGLIEPVMIVFLGLGVGVLLVAILLPIYNIAGGI